MLLLRSPAPPTPLSFTFFFSCPRPPPHLPSSPPRRSSDLCLAGTASPSCTSRREACPYIVSYPPLCRKSTDRKSTRLNSSHITISYAVFCLKKKNTARLYSKVVCFPPYYLAYPMSQLHLNT